MNVLQNIIFPGYGATIPDEMYFRRFGDNIFIREEKKIILDKFASCLFDTYFNGFMLEGWVGKGSIDSLFLKLKGKGRVLFKCFWNQYGSVGALILEKEINLSEVEIDLREVLQWRHGMVCFEIMALEDDVHFEGGAFYTKMLPVNEVKMGLVITHFNRKNYVVPAIKRITADILDNDYYKDKIGLVVVDNSKNIASEESGKAIVIPNQNLGGSGGFTRGLLHLIDEGSFTHCLFMDDDASCEIESILRTYMLLCYVQEEKFAISGAQLRENNPAQIQEKGVVFSEMDYHPLNQWVMVIDKYDVIRTELFSKKPNYGGWWFFAFNISDVEYYPYPFFVRGDDVLFGIVNKFNIFTVSGIACWAEDFFTKESPLTRYLACRGTFVCSLLTEDVSFYRFAKKYTRWFLSNLFSYNYGSAEATILAVEDIAKGPDIFLDDLTAQNIRDKIAPLSLQEKMTNIKREDVVPSFATMHESRWRKLFRILTLNGFLLPHAMLKDGCVFQHKNYRANLREIFRYKKVYYEYEAGHVGYIATHDKKRFFSLLWRFAKSLTDYGFKYKKVRQEYRDRMPEMTSLKFWREVYDGGNNTVTEKTSEKGA